MDTEAGFLSFPASTSPLTVGAEVLPASSPDRHIKEPAGSLIGKA